VDKVTVLDLSKMNFTGFQDVEDNFNLEDILECDAMNVVEYEHPTTVSPERIHEATFTKGIIVNGDKIMREPDPGNHFQKIGAPTKPWLEGHIVNGYADNLSVSDASGTSRRLLLEGNSVTVSYDDLHELSVLATGATTGSYNERTSRVSRGLSDPWPPRPNRLTMHC
jgi:hypothetical protein